MSDPDRYAWHVLKPGYIPQEPPNSQIFQSSIPSSASKRHTADIRTILFYGIVDRTTQEYAVRTTLANYLDSKDESALKDELLHYLTHLDRVSTHINSIEDIEMRLATFAKRVVKEAAKKKIVDLVANELGPETSRLIAAYLEALESLTSLPSTPSAATGTEYTRDLSESQIEDVLARGRARPWARRAQRKMCPLTFLQENYGEWLDHGLSMSLLRRSDRDLYQRLHNWRRRPGNKLPPGVLPSRDDLLNHEVALAAKSPTTMPEARRVHISGRLIRRKLRAMTASQ